MSYSRLAPLSLGLISRWCPARVKQAAAEHEDEELASTRLSLELGNAGLQSSPCSSSSSEAGQQQPHFFLYTDSEKDMLCNQSKLLDATWYVQALDALLDISGMGWCISNDENDTPRYLPSICNTPRYLPGDEKKLNATYINLAVLKMRLQQPETSEQPEPSCAASDAVGTPAATPRCSPQAEINNKVMSVDYNQHRTDIVSADAVSSHNGSVFIVVTGSLTTADGGVYQRFMQSSFLAAT
ncbi:hypothetical protein ACQ4PT_038269 [Festuca glaucescens]